MDDLSLVLLGIVIILAMVVGAGAWLAMMAGAVEHWR